MDLFFPARRRSMICWSMRSPSLARASSSAALSHAQIPLAQQANLLCGVALLDHAIDEVLVFLRFIRACLRVEADHRQQLFGVAEHFLLDHRAQLFVTRPQRVLAAVAGA